MSVINKTPIIQTILSALNATELGTLRDAIDGKGPDPVHLSCVQNTPDFITTSDKGIYPVTLEVSDPYLAQKLYTGYLIYNDSVCAVIAYTSENDCKLRVITINPSNHFKSDVTNSNLSILELRSEINDLLVAAGELVKVQANDVDSGSATSGQVLTANGEGGAAWQNPSGMSNPMTAAGDLIVGGTSGAATRLGLGTAGQVLKVNAAGTGLEYGAGGGEEVVAYEGTSLLNANLEFEDWTLHRFIKNGNVLWLVMTGVIKNNGDSSINISSIFSVTLPSNISSKIYRFDGTTCNQNSSGELRVIKSYTGIWGTQQNNYSIFSEFANILYLYTESTKTLNSGASSNVDVRIPIFLDIGTTQV